MSWNDLPPDLRSALETRLTKGQLDVLTLHLAGCSQRRTADMLGIARTTVKDRLRTALNTITELTKETAA